jgi:hypothetical protein
MNTPGATTGGPAKTARRGAHDGQRFGQVTGRRSQAHRPGAHQGSYLVRDEETGLTYSCGYADIVTEGLRTLRDGERVRFLIDQASPGHARYVIRLDLPDVEDYYK